jgi:hypothetical protein
MIGNFSINTEFTSPQNMQLRLFSTQKCKRQIPYAQARIDSLLLYAQIH